MPTKVQTLEILARKQGIIRARDLRRLGLPSVYLGRLVGQGRLVRRARGVYAAPQQEIKGTHDWELACLRLPNGVMCLLSALVYHGIGTQNPAEVWMAIDVKAWRPRGELPADAHRAFLRDGAHARGHDSPGRCTPLCGFILRPRPSRTASSIATRSDWKSRSKHSAKAGGRKSSLSNNSPNRPVSAASAMSFSRISKCSHDRAKESSGLGQSSSARSGRAAGRILQSPSRALWRRAAALPTQPITRTPADFCSKAQCCLPFGTRKRLGQHKMSISWRSAKPTWTISRAVFKEIVETPVPADGLVFQADSIRVEHIRGADVYGAYDCICSRCSAKGKFPCKSISVLATWSRPGPTKAFSLLSSIFRPRRFAHIPSIRWWPRN